MAATSVGRLAFAFQITQLPSYSITQLVQTVPRCCASHNCAYKSLAVFLTLRKFCPWFRLRPPKGRGLSEFLNPGLRPVPRPAPKPGNDFFGSCSRRRHPEALGWIFHSIPWLPPVARFHPL